MRVVWRVVLLPFFTVWLFLIFCPMVGLLFWAGVVWVVTGFSIMDKTSLRIEWLMQPVDWLYRKAGLLR